MRRYAKGGVWQRKKGAHWRHSMREPIPECKGEEAHPRAATLEDFSHGVGLASSPLARVREALDMARGIAPTTGTREVYDAGLAALVPLERALPVLMETFHENAMRVGNGDHCGKAWQDCGRCRTLLEGK